MSQAPAAHGAAWRCRKTCTATIGEIQKVLDDWLVAYYTKQTHQGRGMNGRTPLKAFTGGIRKQPSKPTIKAKGEPPTTSPKPASMQSENRAN